ncbi:AbrB/MazE/SpoVT family DNA-binding domain-containing protein [Brevundimonas diminuta]|uniref:AbrB/MazE/SpoVT family DNA-binding domain-containing protein n=1 Tax=Brevundimonas diminuta TaxID=293 RepID=UPI003209530E
MRTATVSKWGNSLALRLPQHLAESVRLTEGQTVELAVEDEALVIRPTRKKLKLADLLEGYERRTGEVDWGQPKGDEVW